MKSIYSLLLLLVLSLSSIAQDQNISNGAFFDGEPYIAINPENEDHLVIAWMSAEFLNAIVIRSKVSFDGGESWSTPVFFEHAVSGYTSADVSMQFDSEGNLYAAYVDYDNITASGGAVYVRKSTDGGLSWGDPATHLARRRIS